MYTTQSVLWVDGILTAYVQQSGRAIVLTITVTTTGGGHHEISYFSEKREIIDAMCVRIGGLLAEEDVERK